MGRRWVVVSGMLGLGFACGACGESASERDTSGDTVADTRVDVVDAEVAGDASDADDGEVAADVVDADDGEVASDVVDTDDGEVAGDVVDADDGEVAGDVDDVVDADDGEVAVDSADSGEVEPDTVEPAPRSFFTFQAADRVIGQPDFESGGLRAFAGYSFDFMWGSPELVDDVLFLPNYDGHRVLGFFGVPATPDTPADFVLGQEDFVSSASGDLADEMAGPETVRAHRGRLYVDEYDNNRVSVYRQIPHAHAAADFVIGQPAFGLSEARCSDRGLAQPEDLALVGDRLIIADAGNNRVLIWDQIPDTFDVPADVVLGQANFTTCATNDDDADGAPDAHPSARTLSYPAGVWSDGQRLFVADSDNRRVLVWDPIPTESFTPADFVLGQPDLESADERDPAEGFAYPCYLSGDADHLVLVDNDSHRVVGWNGPVDGPRAPDFVLGQSDLEHVASNDDDQDGRSDAGPSARTFASPAGVVMSGGDLFVTDWGNYRYLRFSPQVCAPGRFESPAGSGRCVDDPCDPNPCGAGSCARSGELAVCTCPADTFGAMCTACSCGLGTCDSGPSGDGSCTCPTGSTGTSCEACATGYYGASCAACGVCQGGCDDGKSGTGECLCADPRYGGAACDTCAFGRQGAGCDGYFTSCSAIKAAQPAAPTRAYVIDPDGVGGADPITVDCDMDTDGGGWTLIMNYVHRGGTNPALVVLEGALPRLGSADLGDDASGTAAWGQGAPSLIARLDPGELRFEGRTSAHSRVVSFATSNVLCVSMMVGGTGSCVSLEPYVTLPGHTAYLPMAQSEGRTAVEGQDTLTDFPFHSIDGFHWNVRAQGGRWDVDDNADSDLNDTVQRVWVRSQCEDERAGRSCERVCPDCGSHGRCDEGRAGTGMCVCEAGWTGATCATTCPSGLAGLSCAPLASCKAIHAAYPAAPSGVYPIDVDGAGPLAKMDAYCDMSTDGGGWTLVLDYLHAGGTNPARVYRRTSLPLKGGEVLGSDESLSSTWGHASPSLLASMGSLGEVRFMCRSSAHSRVLDFKTTSTRCRDYFTTGAGRCDDVATTSTTLPGHDANLPLAATDSFRDYEQRALVEFPFYQSGNYHWGIRGRDQRWECDDFALGPQYATLHRVFVR